jgi:hypothetical protein
MEPGSKQEWRDSYLTQQTSNENCQKRQDGCLILVRGLIHQEDVTM